MKKYNVSIVLAPPLEHITIQATAKGVVAGPDGLAILPYDSGSEKTLVNNGAIKKSGFYHIDAASFSVFENKSKP